MMLVAVSDVDQDDLIELPGANRSRQLPKFEKDDRASMSVVAPTVSAEGARAGE